MKVYLVGGAVRDELLGLPARERDWCVVGATPDDMIEAGFRKVGKDFPVFLHPNTNEEYALARKERKTGPGYHGFSFDTSREVTLEQDLERRDLTINAMARDPDGTLVDPFGGAADLEARQLRHVSDAFREDPVRILRTAKFAARFTPLGFRVAPETVRLMQEMVAAGEVDALVPDRAWKETETALGGPEPRVYFETLRECGALAVIFPEIDALFGVPQPEKWHPEIDCGVHTLMVLEQSARLAASGPVRFAALVHDLGKATTPAESLPRHPGHEKRSVELIRNMARRLPIPTAYRDLAVLVAEFHGVCHRAFELRSSTVLRLFERCDAFRRPERFEEFLLACEADARGRTGFEESPYVQGAWLRSALAAARAVSGRDVAGAETDGTRIGQALRRHRQAAIAATRPAEAPLNG
ncbi:MAG: multifunctional CCA addition/repair protein [Gammaproteobacteria bacterium]|nr:multifunctional CCA addition/repair protein [Gammaproteobacteria bacterium]MDH4253236.1 multifunctional CCA addition/repair protein [Gammaproteobacteria bacterium]MDH5308985.1 multifunctional CCA addition/repair protein [Gammaproteobacteria bacterium]